MRSVALASMIFLAPLVAHAEGHCDSRADCPTSLYGQLHCVHNTCVSEVESVAVKENEETRGYFGVTLGAMLPTIWNNVGEGAQLSARLGLFTSFLQLQVEVSPGATVLGGLSSQAMGIFEASATIAFLPRISDMVYWLVRFGGGAGAIFNVHGYSSTSPSTTTTAFGEIRFDLSGVVIRPSRHLYIELDVPSFRVLFPTSSDIDYPFHNSPMLTWVTSFTVGYVF
jgi:hypothetical protein